MAQSYRVKCSRRQVHCVLVADDLTGACDAAAQFRNQGVRASVHLNLHGAADPRSDVFAFSTDSRDEPAAEMKDRLSRLVSHAQKLRPNIVFKKIDSTLRGNPGGEIAAAFEAFGCELAIIAPAFPDMGRHVHQGYLHSDRDPAWQPIHLQDLLRRQGLHECNHVSPDNLQAALAGECRFVCVDTAANDDLDTIVAKALGCGRRILWAGSAGLASALARALFPVADIPPAVVERQSAPVLFAIGSDHAVTMKQLGEISARYSLQHLDAASATRESLTAALCSRHHTILNIGSRTTTSERLAALLCDFNKQASALLLSGGDTAALVCRAVGAQAIELEGEIVTGLPWGILQGGFLDSMRVATKSGAFGAPGALIEVAEFFSCATP